MDFTAKMAELAELRRMADDLQTMIDSIQDELKAYMTTNNLDTITSLEHKATYKYVAASRIDTTALKKTLPDIAAAYTKKTASMRFTFV